MEWREISYFPGLEINRQGAVRNKETLAAVSSRKHYNSSHIDAIQREGRSSQINILLEEAFGPGAAEAAGFPQPDMEKVHAARERAENVRQGLIAPKAKTGLDAPTFGKRKCTDCGKPTTQYRCEKCWKKRRGFGFEDAGDVPEITGEGSRAHKTAVTAARKRREKPDLFRRDAFVPMAPRPALPDRQAEFFKPKEKTMGERKYTTRELAALVGVDVKGVGNAKHSKTANPMPCSAIFKVREYMQVNGITWEQVVPDLRGRKVSPAMPTPEDVTINALCPPDLGVPEPDPADGAEDGGLDTLAMIEAECEDECAASDASGASGESTPEVFTPARPEYLRDFNRLGHIPLEALVAEITRRVPRAEVVLR